MADNRKGLICRYAANKASLNKQKVKNFPVTFLSSFVYAHDIRGEYQRTG
jgi:hypothetical protein